jgi:flagellar assembly factor FliW
MKFSLKIIESSQEISDKILKALLPDVKQYFANSFKVVRKELPLIVNNSIVNTSEYESIISGKLKYELGIPNSSSVLAGLLNIWSSNIDITYKAPVISNNKIKSSFSISMIAVDFSDVLYSEYAIVSDTLRGYDLPWLQWLLLEGNRILVPNYQVVLGPNKRSRTGFAIMRQSNNKSWKVPAEFSGNIKDNWITRALDKASDEVNTLLKKALS